MSAVACPTCGHRVHRDIEIACPECGNPDPSGKKARAKRARQLFGAAMAVVGIVLFFTKALPQLQSIGLLK